MNKPRIVVCAAALIALLAGCAGAPPAGQHEYLIRPALPIADTAGQPAVRLKPVSVAPYLDQRGIVLQTGAAEIHVATQHAWAEPLDEAIGRYLQVSIANQADREVEMLPLITGSARATISVRIDQLHGQQNGQVRLVAEWIVEPVEGEPVLATFHRSVRQSADGYAALVAAHAELLDELAGAIAGSLE